MYNNSVEHTAGERRRIVLPDCRNPTPYITSRHAPHRGGGGGRMPERELAHSIVGLPECGLSTPPTNCYLRRGSRELQRGGWVRAAHSPSARSSGIYSKPVEPGQLVRVCVSMCPIQCQLSLALKAASSSFILTDNIVTPTIS